MPANTHELSRHRYFRLVWDKVANHPEKDILCFFHGSILVRNGKPITTGLNSWHRIPFTEKYKTRGWENTHSEASVISLAKNKIDTVGSDMYNLRLGLSGEPRNSMPCSGCISMMFDFGVKRCYYSTDDGSVAMIKIADAVEKFINTGLCSKHRYWPKAMAA